MKELSKEQLLELSDLDKLKHIVELSLESHKGYNSEYWKGSAYMGKCVLEAIDSIKKLNTSEKTEQSEVNNT